MKTGAEKKGPRLYSAALMPFILGGLTDSFSPCSASILVLFVGLLFYASSRPRLLLGYGALYILVVGLVCFNFSTGKFEIMRSATPFYWVSRIYFVALGVIFIFFGFRFFFSWLKTRKNPSNVQTLPLAEEGPVTPMNVWESDKKTGPNAIAAFFVVVILGAINTGLSSICPAQAYVTANLYALIVQEQNADAIFCLVLYSLSFVVSLIFILALTYLSMRSKKVSKMLNPFVSTLRILTSAIFLSVGIGLIYTFL